MLSSLGQRELDLQSQRFGAKSAFTFVTARWLAHHPKDGFVDRLQRVDFSPPCYPSYKVSDFYFGGIHSHWTHQPFSWTHVGRVPFPISRRSAVSRVVDSSPRRTAFSSFASRALNPERTSDLSTSILLPRRLSTASILALSSPRMETNSALCWSSSGARKSCTPGERILLRHSSSPP